MNQSGTQTPISWPSISIVGVPVLTAMNVAVCLAMPWNLLSADAHWFAAAVSVLLLLPCMAAASYLPKARLGKFGERFTAPNHTYALSRPLLCLFGTDLLGRGLGTMIAGYSLDWAIVVIGLCQLMIALCFLHSSGKRCKRPPTCEFSLPILRRLFRFTLF